MKNTIVTLTLPNDIIVGCMDFSSESDMEVALTNTLTAFVNLMKARSKIPDRTAIECDEMVHNAILNTKQTDDVFDNVEQFLPQKRSVADIAAEAAMRIEQGSQPQVSLGQLGAIGERVPIEEERVNLYEIAKEFDLATLRRMSPKDRLIELASEIELKAKTQEVTLRELLIIPAVEIVYSSIIQQDWGTSHAEARVRALIDMHGEIPEGEESVSRTG